MDKNSVYLVDVFELMQPSLMPSLSGAAGLQLQV
jgi:hypothetical protein